MRRRGTIAAAAILLCAATGWSQSVRIADVPHVRQKPDFCGEACVEMWLKKSGITDVDQDDVFNLSGLNPAKGRGCWTPELASALAKLGVRTGPVWTPLTDTDQPAQIDAQCTAMIKDLSIGIGSIVCMRTSAAANASEHFRLVLGYDARADRIVYHEPAADRGAYRSMARKEFVKLWPLGSGKDKTLIRFRLDNAALVRPEKRADDAGFTRADFAQHVIKLRERLGKEERDFTIVIQPPFVVLGDEPPNTVRRRAAGTVGWAVDRLKDAYFPKDPPAILDVWLFKSGQSYRTHAKKLFGHTPSTPYGYYSAAAGGLIMNIATGGGTLVHEIVHPLMAANFPDCPPWLNEGLGSLYEQCGDNGGKIWGYTNWRLAGLKKQIKDKSLPTFKKLTAMSATHFYAGANYAQSRYLCYYLQEKGLLRKFYRDFHANAATDPGGYKTLQKTLGEDDMNAFQQRWEKWVLTLRFP